MGFLNGLFYRIISFPFRGFVDRRNDSDHIHACEVRKWLALLQQSTRGPSFLHVFLYRFLSSVEVRVILVLSLKRISLLSSTRNAILLRFGSIQLVIRFSLSMFPPAEFHRHGGAVVNLMSRCQVFHVVNASPWHRRKRR